MAQKRLPKQYAKVLFELTKDAKGKELDTMISTYIKFLREEQVLAKLPYIIDAFVSYAKQQSGLTTISIESARQLSEDEAKAIAAYFGKNTEYTQKTNKKLLGGVKVRKGNTIIDASISSRLEAFTSQLS